MWSSSPIEVLILADIKSHQSLGFERISTRFNFNYGQPSNINDIPDEQWAKIDIIVGAYSTPLEKAVNLKWLQVIDDASFLNLQSIQASHPNLIITTNEGVNTPSLAQHILARLLEQGLLKNQTQDMSGDGESTKRLSGIYSSIIGFLGYGPTAQELTRLLKPFKSTILTATQDAMNPVQHLYIPDGLGDSQGQLFDRLYPLQALTSMAKLCDYLVITESANLDIEKLINPKLLKEMKKSATIIDSSPSSGAHTVDICTAVKNNIIHSAEFGDVAKAGNVFKNKDDNYPKLIFSDGLIPGTNFDDQNFLELLQKNFYCYLKQQELFNKFKAQN